LLRSELHLLDLDDALALLRVLRLLVQLVPILAVVEDAAHRWVGVGGDLDQVEPRFHRHAQRLLGRHDPELLAAVGNDPHFARADLLVDSQFLLDGSSLDPRAREPARTASVSGDRAPRRWTWRRLPPLCVFAPPRSRPGPRDPRPPAC